MATIAVTGGTAHPAGFPLVAMTLHALRWIPGVAPAHSAALGNVLLAIAAFAVLVQACRAWGASPASSAIACVAWALAPTTWALATEAESFAMHALLTACIAWLAAPELRLAATRRAVALAFVAGLALANNYTIGALAPLGLYAFVRAVRASSQAATTMLAAFLALSLGLAPYAHLFFTAKQALDPTSWSWGDVHDAASFVAFVSRAEYHELGLTSPHHLIAQLARVTSDLAAFPIVALGGAALWYVRHRRDSIVDRTRVLSWVALAASIVVAGPVFTSVFNVPLDGEGGAVAARFDLLPMTLLTIAIARGLDELVARRLSRPAVAVGATGALFALLLARGLPEIRTHQRPGVELYAHNVLLSAPENAIVLGTGDARFGAMLYARYALGERPDVAFVDPQLLLAPWYHARIERVLGVKLPEVTSRSSPDQPPRDARDRTLSVVALVDALLATGRPVLVTDLFSPKGLGRYASYPIGPLVRLVANGAIVPLPDDLERMNLALAARFAHEPLPLVGPEPWSDALAGDYARPWEALAQAFARAGDRGRAAANVQRAYETRNAAAWR
jgi:hypothetical protein